MCACVSLCVCVCVCVWCVCVCVCVRAPTRACSYALLNLLLCDTMTSFHQLAEIVPIDLLMGGSPCNELSLANPLRKGFDVGKFPREPAVSFFLKFIFLYDYGVIVIK